MSVHDTVAMLLYYAAVGLISLSGITIGIVLHMLYELYREEKA